MTDSDHICVAHTCSDTVHVQEMYLTYYILIEKTPIEYEVCIVLRLILIDSIDRLYMVHTLILQMLPAQKLTQGLAD